VFLCDRTGDLRFNICSRIQSPVFIWISRVTCLTPFSTPTAISPLFGFLRVPLGSGVSVLRSKLTDPKVRICEQKQGLRSQPCYLFGTGEFLVTSPYIITNFWILNTKVVCLQTNCKNMQKASRNTYSKTARSVAVMGYAGSRHGAVYFILFFHENSPLQCRSAASMGSSDA
jgi:hypothetical protein